MTSNVELTTRPEPPFNPTVPGLLHHIAQTYGDRIAHAGRGDRLTFEGLEERSALYARGLLSLGVGKGTRVAVMLPNGPEFVAAFMAAARIGALVAPLSTLYQAPELRWVLDHADIHTLIVADGYLRHDYLARLEEALPSLNGQAAGRLALPEAPYLRQVLVWGERSRDWARPGSQALREAAAARPEFDAAFLERLEQNIVPADLLCIIHTSGSTAEPKGVVHSHGAMIRHSYQKAFHFWPLGEGDVAVGVRPFFWVAGLAASVFQCLVGGRPLYTPDDDSGAAVVRLIETEGVNAVCSSEAYMAMLRTDADLAAAGYEIVRESNDCGAFARRMPEGLKFLTPRRAGWTPKHPHPPKVPRSYGMTETLSAHTTLPSGQLLPDDKLECCGRTIPGVKLRIVDQKTREPLPPGEVGEVEVAGYSLMQGIYKRERDDVFTPDGWYATGDLCRRDADGYLFFSNRIGEMIKVHGANVAPLEVEFALNAQPQIARSAVVGLPDVEGGSVLVAAVEVRPGRDFDAEAVRAVLKTQLSSYKVPRRIFAMAADEFPLTGSGKIVKSALVPLLTQRLAAEGAVEG
jgi:acyl-coenzyme A synthetase/AMP-(fatty) acid ligase